eukprot:jgi/Psemu1/12617/gm1.12617_g
MASHETYRAFFSDLRCNPFGIEPVQLAAIVLAQVYQYWHTGAGGAMGAELLYNKVQNTFEADGVPTLKVIHDLQRYTGTPLNLTFPLVERMFGYLGYYSMDDGQAELVELEAAMLMEPTPHPSISLDRFDHRVESTAEAYSKAPDWGSFIWKVRNQGICNRWCGISPTQLHISLADSKGLGRRLPTTAGSPQLLPPRQQLPEARIQQYDGQATVDRPVRQIGHQDQRAAPQSPGAGPTERPKAPNDFRVVQLLWSELGNPTPVTSHSHSVWESLLAAIAHQINRAHPWFGSIYLAKIGLSDSLYQQLHPEDTMKLGVLGTSRQSHPMGWASSTPNFCACTETIKTLANMELVAKPQNKEQTKNGAPACAGHPGRDQTGRPAIAGAPGPPAMTVQHQNSSPLLGRLCGQFLWGGARKPISQAGDWFDMQCRQEPVSEKKLLKGGVRWSTIKHKVLGELWYMALAIPRSLGLFSILQEAFHHVEPERQCLRLTKTFQGVFSDFQWLAQDIGSRLTRIAELIPDPIPVTLGACNVPKTAMGQFPQSVQNWLVSFDNPQWDINNSSLELTGSIAWNGILAMVVDITEQTAHSPYDNTATMYWQQKGATTTISPATYLLKLQGTTSPDHRMQWLTSSCVTGTPPLTNRLLCSIMNPQAPALAALSPKTSHTFRADLVLEEYSPDPLTPILCPTPAGSLPPSLTRSYPLPPGDCLQIQRWPDCPRYRRMATRELSLLAHVVEISSALAKYYNGRGRRVNVPVKVSMITTTLCWHSAILEPSRGISPKYISTRYLRAGGAISLLQGNCDTNAIQLLTTQWQHGYAMLRYLHQQSMPVFKRLLSSVMFNGGRYSFLPETLVPAAPPPEDY